MNNLDTIYQTVTKKEVNQDEMVEAVEFFLLKVKGVRVKITAPYLELTNHPFAQMIFKRRSDMLVQAYGLASRFIVLLKEDPELVKDKLYG